MRLLLVRHAEAADTGFGTPVDFDRTLTPRGLQTAARLAETLKGMRFQLEFVKSSPLLRATQTATPLLVLCPAGSQLSFCPELAPDSRDPAKVAAAINALKAKSVAVVGHLPDMAEFASWLLGGAAIRFERGSAALLDIAGPVGPNSGALNWLLTPDWY